MTTGIAPGRWVLDPNSIAYDPASIAYDPNSIAYDPNSIAYDPESIAFDPDLIAFDPNSIAYDPNSIAHDPVPKGIRPQFDRRLMGTHSGRNILGEFCLNLFPLIPINGNIMAIHTKRKDG